MELPKIHLSDAEEKLMLDAEVILTKNRVLEQMKNLLGSVEARQYAFVMNGSLHQQSPFTVPGKISRGENYMGLPWLMLDYPRLSVKEGHFFIRILFWWGKFFSTTLHLSGMEKEKYLPRILGQKDQLYDHYIGVNTDPWQHHYGRENYRKIAELDNSAFQAVCREGSHLKISVPFPLEQWTSATEQLFGQWKLLLEVTGLIA